LPKVTVFHDERVLARTLAAQIVETIAQKPDLVLGLPTGRTPIRLYHELGALHAKGQADFSRVTTFNLDEFLGVPPEHAGSYRAFMQEHLFSRVNLAEARINMLNGVAPDPLAECIRYERAIAAAGGLDLQGLDAAQQRRAVRRRRGQRPARSAVDGDGHHPARAAHHPDRNGEVEGRLRRACGTRPDHDADAGVVLTAAP
jgi:hypothetical protein